MLVTNHVLSGALIGHAVPSPLAAFALGVASHLVLDAVPHWGGDRPIAEMMHVAVPDGLIGATTMAVLTAVTDPERRLAVLAGMAGAAFLDLDKPSTVFFGFSPFPEAVDAFHGRIQCESPRRMPQEVLVGALGMVALAVLTRRRRTGRPAGNAGRRMWVAAATSPSHGRHDRARAERPRHRPPPAAHRP